jgi:hypothetical protein
VIALRIGKSFEASRQGCNEYVATSENQDRAIHTCNIGTNPDLFLNPQSKKISVWAKDSGINQGRQG